MKKLLLLVVLLSISAAAQTYTKNDQFVYAGTGTPSQNFNNTGIISFSIAWSAQSTVFTCSVQVDSSADGVTWGNGDLISTQNCAGTPGLSSTATLAGGKNYVRAHVTVLTGNGGVNTTIQGYTSSGSSAFSTITAGTNTAALVIGSGGSITTSGTGSIQGTLGQGASPAMAYYLAPQCPASNTSQCYQTPANTQVAAGCTVSTSNQNVVCASGTFTSADVGKTLFGSAGCDPFQGNIVLAYTTPVTISSFSSSTTVGVSAVSAINNSTACIVWGNPDDTAAAALDTFFATASNTGDVCPKIFLSATGYMFTAPHFFTQPAACTGLPSLAGGGATGNLILAQGFEVEGRGPGETIIWLPPDFPESGACTHGVNSDSCFAVPLEGRYREFQIAGTSNNAGSNIPSNHAIINVDVGSLEYFTCTGLANLTATTPHYGVEATHWARLIQVNVSSCGNTNLYVTGTTDIYGMNVALENAFPINANSANLLMNGSKMYCIQCDFFGDQLNTAISTIVQGLGTLTLLHPAIQSGIGASAVQVGYECLGGPCTLVMEDAIFAPQGTNSVGLFCNVACTIDLLRSKVVGAGSGEQLDITTSASSSIVDRGGNTFSGGTGANVISGTYSAPGHAVNGACTGVGTASSTLGLFGTGPNVTATTCTSTTIGSGIVMAYPGTLATLMASATAAGTNASSGVVTVLKNGSTTTLTCTIGTGTSCIDGTHTVTYVAGDLISLEFTTQTADTLAGVKAQVIY